MRDKLAVDSVILFCRMLVVSKFRDINLETVLKYELATVPPFLFHDDGMIKKAVKSYLTNRLEEKLYSITNIALRCQHGIYHRWYCTSAEFVIELIHISCISIIFDRYDNAH